MFTIITGSQFGDEGKGKIVDYLAKESDILVRFQGGDNAGHTVVVGEETYRLHLIPSGVLYNKRLLIGPGVVMNPETLVREISELKNSGIDVNPKKLGVDAKTSIVMPYHVELDSLREVTRPDKIGTTKRGIGLAYEDKVSREEIRFSDLINGDLFLEKLEKVAPIKEIIIGSLGGDKEIVRRKENISKYIELGRFLRDYITDVSFEVNQGLKEGRKIIAEGAQGTFLDVIHGTQKYVTSSSTVAGSACSNLGVGPTKVDEVIGVVKAYITRVGGGPLLTEIKDPLGDKIREVGGEYGTTTGRPRRCGWLDGVLLRKAIFLNGYTSLALTKLDVLTGIDPIKISLDYEFDGETLRYPPETTGDLERCKPIYEELSGWKEDIREIKDFDRLPKTCKNYIYKIEEVSEVPIKFISLGPRRDQIIDLR